MQCRCTTRLGLPATNMEVKKGQIRTGFEVPSSKKKLTTELFSKVVLIEVLLAQFCFFDYLSLLLVTPLTTPITHISTKMYVIHRATKMILQK